MKKIIKSNQKGFTLVELLVVIAIIGILAAIAVPRFASATNSATVSAVLNDHRIMMTAINTYMGNNNSDEPKLTTFQVDMEKYLPGNWTVASGVVTVPGAPVDMTMTITDGSSATNELIISTYHPLLSEKYANSTLNSKPELVYSTALGDLTKLIP